MSKKKYIACTGCGFMDDNFDTGRGDEIFNCAKLGQKNECDRIYYHDIEGGDND